MWSSKSKWARYTWLKSHGREDKRGANWTGSITFSTSLINICMYISNTDIYSHWRNRLQDFMVNTEDMQEKIREIKWENEREKEKNGICIWIFVSTVIGVSAPLCNWLSSCTLLIFLSFRLYFSLGIDTNDLQTVLNRLWIVYSLWRSSKSTIEISLRLSRFFFLTFLSIYYLSLFILFIFSYWRYSWSFISRGDIFFFSLTRSFICLCSPMMYMCISWIYVVK